ncbi:MAG: hypothetical protein E6905_02615, partial [Actinomyces sp.]|nr:hypothetical protein [Actinomyces sp.]
DPAWSLITLAKSTHILTVQSERDSVHLFFEERTVAQQHPQLCRQEWLDLTGQWLFAYDDEDRGLSEH